MNIIETMLQEAHSFPDLQPPNDAVEYGRVHRNGQIYIVYIDKSGECYYDTVRGLQFKKEMEMSRKRKRR